MNYKLVHMKNWQKVIVLLLEHYGALLVIFCSAQLFLLLFANLKNSKKFEKGVCLEVAKRSNHLSIVIYEHLHHLDK
jgi:hypothetical protein